MALAKDRTPYGSHMSLVQACSLYGNVHGESSIQVSDLSSQVLCGFNEYHNAVFEAGDGLENTSGFVKNLFANLSSPLSSPSSTNSNGHAFGPTNYQPEEAHSVINFKTGYDNFMHASESLLSFEQNQPIPKNTHSKITNQNECTIWENYVNNDYENQLSQKSITNLRLMENFSCYQTASSYGSVSNTIKEKQQLGEELLGWFYSEGTANGDSIHDSGTQDAGSYKRPHTSQGESMQALKKQCTGAMRKPKPKSIPSKDPQSIAAKNRRERISERLKILQELVPNGSKVDLVTMLEKAISYVKFLQLQVKVLATDEFWPVQGGKAPEISQVKEAIDAVLSSQRDRKSSSK